MLPDWLKQELERYELGRILLDGRLRLLRLGFLSDCLTSAGWRSCVSAEAQEVGTDTHASKIKA